MLTQKQESFVRELIKGKSQREAYMASYDASRMKPRTIDCKASLLFRRDDIRARYDELRALSEEKAGDDAVSMRAFIIEQYKKIASGEIHEQTREYDSDGVLIKSKDTIKASDVSNALSKLADLYGVTGEELDATITVRFEETEYGD